jgi:hypothetical protein
MTIFGFNTNVQRDDVTYHVESQARQSDLLLQTMVFVKGQCVGKHAFSYAAMTLEPGFSEAAMHNLLKAQHKDVIDALQYGSVEGALASSTEIQDVGGSGLSLKWTNPNEAARENQIVLNLQVLDSGAPVSGADLSIRAFPLGEGAVLAQSLTDASGTAALVVPAAEADQAVLAQAKHGGKSATRKLRLRK